MQELEEAYYQRAKVWNQSHRRYQPIFVSWRVIVDGSSAEYDFLGLILLRNLR